MSDLVSKTLLSGLGLASLTKDAIAKMATDLAKNANLSEEEGRRVVKHLQKRSAHLEKALEETVETAVHKVVKKLNLDKAAKKKSRKS